MPVIRVDDIPSMKSPVYVGNQGEKNILTLDFDYTSWHALYGNGTFSATYQNPKGRINLLPPSDFSTEITGENEDLTYILHFTVTKNITAISGTGTLCLYYMGIGESFSKTSVLVPVVVEKGHDTTSHPPAIFQDWVDQAHSTLEEMAESESLREIGEQNRQNAYGQAELARNESYSGEEAGRDNLYLEAEQQRNATFGSEENRREDQFSQSIDLSDQATQRANTLSDDLGTKWGSADVDLEILDEDALPSASIIQGQSGTLIDLKVPRGFTGPQGPKGDIQFVAFYIDFSTGQLMMIIPEGYTGPIFRLNEETGELEVTV